METLALKDYILLLVIGIWFLAALYKMRKVRKSGGCVGCSGCNQDCSKCAHAKIADQTESVSDQK